MRKASGFPALMLAVTWVFGCSIAGAQQAAAPSSLTRAATQIDVGPSYVALTGPWRFSPGDSPTANAQLLWSRPGFDDIAWDTMDLSPAPGSTNLFYGDSGYLSGWAARGYPRLANFAWYRLRLHLVNAAQSLALKMPDHVDDAYQVYANGRLIGEMGRFTSRKVISYRTIPMVFALPRPDADGNIELAIRFYMEPWVLALGTAPDAGGMHSVPIAGLPSVAESLRRDQMRLRILSGNSTVFVDLLTLIAGAGAFWLWVLDRPRSTYLWLTLALLSTLAAAALELFSQFSFALTQDREGYVFRLFTCLSVACWIVFWRKWFSLERNRGVYALLIGLIAAQVLLGQWIFGFSDNAGPTLVLHIVELWSVCMGIFCLPLFFTFYQAARKDRLGALLALPAILFISIYLFEHQVVAWLRVPTHIFFSSGLNLGLDNIAGALVVLVITLQVVRRFVRTRIAQRLESQSVAQDLEQARSLQQQVLVPETLTSTAFSVQTIYRPALTVGGDFYQVISLSGGRLLVVIGDVSGKGIAAAMLVAVLVGAVRTRADETSDPAALLDTLNQRLLGRAGGHFATCLAACLEPDGKMVLANAGHLPPYRNGVPLDLAGSLPLGLASDACYDSQAIQLQLGDYLTFLTDGVLEARNAEGELLGFDRVAEIAALPADQIAQAAIAHGQDDDITVLGITLLRARRLAIASAPSDAVPSIAPA